MDKKIWMFFFVVCALTLVYFLPYSLRIWDSVPNVIDPLFYSWNIHHNAYALTDPGRSLLDTNIFFPLTNTIAYSDTLWGLLPFTSPLIWITRNPIFVQNFMVLLTFPLAAITMFLLVHYLTHHRVSAYLTALFFAFSYPRIAQIGHLPFLGSFWIPLVLLYVIRFFKDGSWRSLLYAYLFFALSFSTSIYIGLLILPMILIAGITFVLDLIIRKNTKTIRAMVRSLILLSIPFAVGFVGIAIPYIRLSAEYPEYKRTLFDTLELRAFPVDYISVTPSSLLGSLGLPTAPAEHSLYPTLTLFILSIWGTFLSWKSDRKIFWVCLFSVFTYVILSFGAELTLWGKSFTMPYSYLFDKVLLLRTIRVPARFGMFVIFNLCLLAGFSLREIIQKKKLSWIALPLVFFFILETINTSTDSVRVAVGKSIPPVYSWLKNKPQNAIVAELPLRLFYNGSPMKDQLMKPYRQLGAYDNYAAETYRIYFSTYHHKYMINGYSGFFPDSYNKMAASLESFPSDSSVTSLKNAGVTIIILHGDEFGNNLNTVLTGLDNRIDLRRTEQFGNDYVYEFEHENI